MKKILCFILVLILSLSMCVFLAGCGTADITAGLPDGSVAGSTPAEIVSDFINAALRLVLLAVTVLFSKIILPFFKKTVVPYLEGKSLYRTIQLLVAAAEKQGETGVIPKERKKAFVVSWLTALGITVTEAEEQMIEAAVEELDKMGSQLIEAVIGETETLGPAFGPESPDPDE